MSDLSQGALVSWEEIQDIELVVLGRMKEFAMGAHASVFQGSGFNLIGLREWQPGDRPSAVDWPQSTLTNFSPLMTREFEQESTASVVIVADTSRSTRCGVNDMPIAKVIARTVATLGMAAAFFQDSVGLVTLSGASRRLVVRPRVGKNHAIHCVEAYQAQLRDPAADNGNGSEGRLAGLVRKRSVMPVVSDFLVEDSQLLIAELSELNASHDVFLVMVDSAFAFDRPSVSDGWVEGLDVETGQSRIMSAAQLQELDGQVREWQDAVQGSAREAGLDVVRISAGEEHGALSEFLSARRLRKR